MISVLGNQPPVRPGSKVEDSSREGGGRMMVRMAKQVPANKAAFPSHKDPTQGSDIMPALQASKINYCSAKQDRKVTAVVHEQLMKRGDCAFCDIKHSHPLPVRVDLFVS